MTRRILGDDTKTNLISVNVRTGAVVRDHVFDYAVQGVAAVPGSPETLVAVGGGCGNLTHFDTGCGCVTLAVAV
jgi:hypothetical protein